MKPKTEKLRDKVIGAAVGGGLGAYVGSSIGIAALGTATAGTVPVAIAGAYVGYKVVQKMREKR